MTLICNDYLMKTVCVCVACAFFGSAAVLDADLNLDSIHSWFLHGSQWSDVW